MNSLPVRRSTSTSETTAPQILYPSSLSCTACPLFKINKYLEHWIQRKFRIVASRSMCYSSENQKFGFLKSGLLTCRLSFLRIRLLFCFQDRKLEFSTSYWFRSSRILWTTFIFGVTNRDVLPLRDYTVCSIQGFC